MNPTLLFRYNACRRSGKPAVPVWLFCLILGAATLGFSSCRTAQGFGQDVEHVGDPLRHALP